MIPPPANSTVEKAAPYECPQHGPITWEPPYQTWAWFCWMQRQVYAAREQDRQDFLQRLRDAPVVSCACGCGGLRPAVDVHGKRRLFINGHSGTWPGRVEVPA